MANIKEHEPSVSPGFESKLWDAADHLRQNLGSAEYKDVVLGLLFLKHLDDVFEERREAVRAAVVDPTSDFYLPDEGQRLEALPNLLEQRDVYTAANVFWVPAEARWSHIHGQAEQATIGTTIDEAMDVIERENDSLEGVLPKIYARPNLDHCTVGKLVELVGDVEGPNGKLSDLFDYFLIRFASMGDRGAAEFHTPRSVVDLMVALVAPSAGRVYDPCCGSAGLLQGATRFVEQHGGRPADLSIVGQEFDVITWRLARMNLAIHGLEANLGARPADTFAQDLHPDLKADYVLAAPPFNLSAWGGEVLQDDPRWIHGVPPETNANFAWLQHAVHHMADSGRAALALTNNSLFSTEEREIRRSLLEAGLVECIVACPAQMFQTTDIPVSIWVLRKAAPTVEDREVLFIDARKVGRTASRFQTEIDDDMIHIVAGLLTDYWRSGDDEYQDFPGLCRSVSLSEIAANDFGLIPATYVGPDPSEQTHIEAVATQLEVIVGRGASANLVAPEAHVRARICEELRSRLSDCNVVSIDASRRDWAELGRLRDQLAHGGVPSTVLLIENWRPITVGDHPEVWANWLSLLNSSPKVGIVVSTSERIALLQSDATQVFIPNKLLSGTRIVDADRHPSRHLNNWFGPASSLSGLGEDLDRSYRNVWVEESDVMLRTFGRLADDAYQILEMRTDGLDEEEIAQELNIPEAEAALLLASAQAQFSRAYAEEVFNAFGDAEPVQEEGVDETWEIFLRELADEHPWLGDELAELGFRFDGDTPFASFLDRQNLEPTDFVVMLFRPSDMRRMFGSFDPALGVKGNLLTEYGRFLERQIALLAGLDP